VRSCPVSIIVPINLVLSVSLRFASIVFYDYRSQKGLDGLECHGGPVEAITRHVHSHNLSLGIQQRAPTISGVDDTPTRVEQTAPVALRLPGMGRRLPHTAQARLLSWQTRETRLGHEYDWISLAPSANRATGRPSFSTTAPCPLRLLLLRRIASSLKRARS
jgi:hypothetical protein